MSTYCTIHSGAKVPDLKDIKMVSMAKMYELVGVNHAKVKM